jgi:hypothetical protein
VVCGVGGHGRGVHLLAWVVGGWSWRVGSGGDAAGVEGWVFGHGWWCEAGFLDVQDGCVDWGVNDHGVGCGGSRERSGSSCTSV